MGEERGLCCVEEDGRSCVGVSEEEGVSVPAGGEERAMCEEGSEESVCCRG